MGKIKQIIEKIKAEEVLTTQEVLTKYSDLAILLEQEEQQEKLNESKDGRVLLKS
tara:strand:+ start:521 stop:685 length:165 start_codon:yes stop_codon:yes gene_type:complete